MMQVEHISFTYGKGTVNECPVLKDISFSIQEGDFIGLIGSSGSGKTTLIKHLNGLLKADSGAVFFRGQNIYDRSYVLSGLRREVGLVFQYPEQQLFKQTVLADVCFGPLNLGMTKEEAENSAKACLELVGMDPSCYYESPLELSGGQKRCVAIAGVLAMNPRILVMDEPAAGLDPETKHMIFSLVEKIQKERKIAIVLVSHHMEDVAQYANRVLVLHEGSLVLSGTPQEIFTRTDLLKEIGIGVPQITSVTDRLKRAGIPLTETAVTLDQAEDLILRAFGRKGGNDRVS
jgi:energy-coupling factor transport system ATP-binding protein